MNNHQHNNGTVVYHHTILYCTVLYCTVLCCAVLCCAVLCCAVILYIHYYIDWYIIAYWTIQDSLITFMNTRITTYTWVHQPTHHLIHMTSSSSSYDNVVDTSSLRLCTIPHYIIAHHITAYHLISSHLLLSYLISCHSIPYMAIIPYHSISYHTMSYHHIISVYILYYVYWWAHHDYTIRTPVYAHISLSLSLSLSLCVCVCVFLSVPYRLGIWVYGINRHDRKGVDGLTD
jgi:hypothetical protein